ncbi:hypothetical protein ROU88_10935 [Macrococcus capreoli]
MNNPTPGRKSPVLSIVILIVVALITFTLMKAVPFEYHKIPMFIGLAIMMPLAMHLHNIRKHNKNIKTSNVITDENTQHISEQSAIQKTELDVSNLNKQSANKQVVKQQENVTSEQETQHPKVKVTETNVPERNVNQEKQIELKEHNAKDDLAVKDPSVYENSVLHLTHEEYTKDEETYKQYLNEKVAKIIVQSYNFLPPGYDKFLIFYTRNKAGQLVGEIGLKMHEDDENYIPLDILTQMYDVDMTQLKPEIEIMEQDIADIINPEAKPPIGDSIKALVVEHQFEGKSNCNFIYYDISGLEDVSVHELYLHALKLHTNHQAYPENFDETYKKIDDEIKLDYERRHLK